jgi:DNA-binding CsgD family transcriptional regulator
MVARVADFRGPPARADRPAGGPPQRNAYGSVEFVRERLEALAEAFLVDSRPGFIFEYGRLIFANEAARSVLSDRGQWDPFFALLKRAIEAGGPAPDAGLDCAAGSFSAVLHPGRCRQGHATRICFLIRKADSPVHPLLSSRETEVLQLLVEGLKNGQIAERLGISIETVRKHVSSALEKTGTKTRAGLVAKALAR